MTFTTAPILETDRLLLRPYRLEDFKGFAELLGSARSQFMDGPASRTAAWNRFAAGAGAWSLVGYGPWAIERKEDKLCIGIVSLNHPIGDKERELGWALWEPFSGQGYAFEAAKHAQAFAFDRLDWPTMVSYISSPNTASIKLAERLGATPDSDATAEQKDNTRVYRHKRS